MALLWGVDLGGTKIEAVVLDPEAELKCVARHRIPTESNQGYDHILSRIKSLLDSLKDQVGRPPLALGIGHPGSVHPISGLLRNSNTVCMNSKPFQSDLIKLLGIPVVCQNDANCFAVAEARLGAAKQAKTVFGIIMGTGVGGGLVIDGHALSGRQGIAGEWGHNILIEDGPLCYCGRRGCVETVLSGPALEKHYRDQTGLELRLPEILKRARAGDDPIALKTVERLIDYFGKAVAVVINIFDPHMVVLGGGVSNTDELLTLGKESLKKWVFHDSFTTPIVRNELGDSAGVFGAALLVADDSFIDKLLTAALVIRS